MNEQPLINYCIPQTLILKLIFKNGPRNSRFNKLKHNHYCQSVMRLIKILLKNPVPLTKQLHNVAMLQHLALLIKYFFKDTNNTIKLKFVQENIL